MQDPWEGFNRKMFAFNDTLDRWVLKPVAKGYDFLIPDLVQSGIGNFFSNLSEVGNVGNDILQWKWKKAGVDSGRFVVNSTIGIAGLFDVASEIGLEQGDGEDAGQTFEAWGIKQGPYVVLPFFGPSTVRETFARPVDMFLDPVFYVDDTGTRVGLTATRLVHNRYELFEQEALLSGDRYLFIRDAYLQRRQYLYNDGEISDSYEDDFGDEDF
jgi:phospholipid-binding lipoprotein MlaA